MGKDQSVRLEVKERPDVGVYVKELSVFMVNNADDMDKLMTVGNRWEGVTTTNSVSLFRRKRERKPRFKRHSKNRNGKNLKKIFLRWKIQDLNPRYR